MLEAGEFLKLQAVLERVHLERSILEYAVSLVEATRHDDNRFRWKVRVA